MQQFGHRFHLNGKTMGFGPQMGNLVWQINSGRITWYVSEKLRGEDFKVQTSQEVPSTMGDPILKTFDVFFYSNGWGKLFT